LSVLKTELTQIAWGRFEPFQIFSKRGF